MYQKKIPYLHEINISTYDNIPNKFPSPHNKKRYIAIGDKIQKKKNTNINKSFSTKEAFVS